jgi:hypothetical protein
LEFEDVDYESYSSLVVVVVGAAVDRLSLDHRGGRMVDYYLYLSGMIQKPLINH